MKDIIEIISNQKFLSAVLSTLIVIMISFILRRKNIIKDNARKVVADIVLKLALPAMAFNAFMSDFNRSEAKSTLQVFFFGLGMYLLMIFGLKLLFKHTFKSIPEKTKQVFQIVIIFGNVTFFTFPIVADLYGDVASIPGQIMILVFRIFAYSYAFFTMAGIKVDKEHIGNTVKSIIFNPIVVCTFIGLIIWLTQDFLPTVNVNGVDVSILRFDKSLPAVYPFVKYLSNMCTPLSWVLIGLTIGEATIGEAFKSKSAWFLALARTIAIPTIALALIVLLQFVGITNVSKYGFIACVLMLASPLSVVINTYSVKYDRDSYLVSDVCFLSTILGIVTVPMFIVIVEIISKTALFA